MSCAYLLLQNPQVYRCCPADGKGVAAPIFIDDLEMDLKKKMFSGEPKEKSLEEFLGSFKQEGS